MAACLRSRFVAILVAATGWLLSTAVVHSAPVDSGMAIDALNREFGPAHVANEMVDWIRIRGFHRQAVPRNGPEVDLATVQRDLIDLNQKGFRLVPLMRWAPSEWTAEAILGQDKDLSLKLNFTNDLQNGTRSRGHLPIDLRLAFARGYWLGKTYGKHIAAWEIDNEADLGFTPENAEHYAAFLKAMYLGLRAGSTGREKLETRGGNSATDVQGTLPMSDQVSVSQSPSSLVLMAPLGIPPGPWFERFVSNDGLSYTDGFNYHYYGYADDFTGVYRAHETAVRELSGRLGSANRFGNQAGVRRELPVFITELGYGMLGQDSAGTKAGRLRQWRWFRDVRLQAQRLRIDAPMAFYVPPYLEYAENEYGLTVKASAQSESGIQRTALGEELAVSPASSATKVESAPSSSWSAGNITYAPHDFGVRSTQSWMELIGRKIAESEITPALAYWLRGLPKETRPPIRWAVNVAPPSSIVIDFVAQENLSAVKRYNAYFANGEISNPRGESLGERPDVGAQIETSSDTGKSTRATRKGKGDLVLYNFSERPVSGLLLLPPNLHLIDLPDQSAQTSGGDSHRARSLSLSPMERRVVSVGVNTSRAQPLGEEAPISFTPDDQNFAPSHFVTKFMPSPVGLRQAIITELFDRFASRKNNTELIAKRPRANEESPEIRSGLWFQQEGAQVQPTSEGFVIKIIKAAPGKVHRVEVELPWPDDAIFPSDGALSFDIRLRGKTLSAKEFYAVHVRSRNGTMFEVYPRRQAIAAWTNYFEPHGNFGMSFYARANLPWRFADNQPMSLVLVLYPKNLPAEYEVRHARIVRVQSDVND